MAGVENQGLLILTLFTLIVGLVAGIAFEPGIHKKLSATLPTWIGICLTMTTLALIVGTIRLPAPGRPAPPSLEEEQALGARLLADAPNGPDPSQLHSGQEIVQHETISFAHKTPVPSFYSPRILSSDGGESGMQTAITRLVIPSLHLDARVKSVPYDGFTWDITGLNGDVAVLETPSGLDTTNNNVLAGHISLSDASNGPFRYLFMLLPGEQVKTYTEDSMYTYIVRDQDVVDATDIFVMSASDKPVLTLLTCTDWDENAHSYRRRRIVLADLVDVAPLIHNSAR